jgi:hypothetical protein
MAVSGKGPAPREVPFALLTDIPDAEAEGKAVAEALSQFASFGRGLLAARPAATAKNEGHMYWATDDTTYGPNGTIWISAVAKWEMSPVLNVLTADINNLAVTTAKLAEEAVTLAKLSVTLLGPIASNFGLRKLGQNALEAAPGNDPRIVHSGEEDNIQRGVVLGTDWKLSTITINSVTGELTFTAGGTLWVENEATGGLVRTFVNSKVWKISPASLPVTTKWRCIGIELSATEAGWQLEPTMTNVAGTEQTTEALALSNSPAITAHKTRVADIPIWNNVGVYSLGPARDRRMWAKGLKMLTPSEGVLGKVSATETLLKMPARGEFSGKPVRATLNIRLSNNVKATIQTFEFLQDGATNQGTVSIELNQISPAFRDYTLTRSFTPAAGTHLFQLRVNIGDAGTEMGSASLLIEEFEEATGNNGTA